jgi:hypothetical protein
MRSDERQATPVRLAELHVDGESARNPQTHRGRNSPHWPYDDRPLPAIAKLVKLPHVSIDSHEITYLYNRL